MAGRKKDKPNLVALGAATIAAGLAGAVSAHLAGKLGDKILPDELVDKDAARMAARRAAKRAKRKANRGKKAAAKRRGSTITRFSDEYNKVVEEGEKRIASPKRRVKPLKFPKFGPPGIGRGRGG